MTERREGAPVAPSTHPQSLLWRRLTGAVAVTLLLPAFVGSAASADPIADKKAEADRIAKQLDSEGNQVSMAAETLNRARLKLDDIHASMASAQANLDRANRRMQAVRGLLSQAAVQAYVSGGSASLFAHLAHSDNGDLVLRKQYLSFTAADQSDVLGQLRAAKEDFFTMKARLAGSERDAAAASAQADAAWRDAADADAAQRALLGKVTGELGDLVSAEQARQAAAQAAAAAAKLAELTKTTTPDRPAIQKAIPLAATPVKGAAKPAVAVGPPPPASRGAAAAVAEAERQVGKPYVYGGAGPNSFDCSGLVMWAWRAGGVSLSHSALTQWYETTRVPLNAIQPGDILFYGSSVQGIGHDAIYVGGGQMVEAPHTGLNVRYASPYRPDLLGAGRPG